MPEVSAALALLPGCTNSWEGLEEPVSLESLYFLPAACVFLFHSEDDSLGVTSCINNRVYSKFDAETVSSGSQESTDLFGLLCSFLLSLSQQSLAFGNGNCLLSDHCLKMGFKANSPLDPGGRAWP